MAFAVAAAVPCCRSWWRPAEALVAAAVLAAVALFAVGAAISLVTNRQAGRSGLRQLAVGTLTAAGTYLVGRVVGANLS